jgi:apolipoprotein D and lipocalin family protein
MFKILILTIIFTPFYLPIITAQNDMKKAPPVTVDYVDLQKYSGLWYEIAKIPNSFQDQCKYGTTAEYIIDKGGDITVINKCYQEEGKLDVAEGVANIVDKKTNSKLEVSFVSFLGIRPFWGDYWIIGLDEDYTYAVIGHPKRKYGWILSRKPSLTEEKIKQIFELLKSQGYDPKRFEMTVHNK